MKTLGFTAVATLVIGVVVVLAVTFKFTSLFLVVPSALAQAVEALRPKIVQTPTQIVVFENPLIDQEGLSVEEVVDRREELLGKTVTIKGTLGKIDKEWGFWLQDSSGATNQIFIVNNAQLASSTVANFTLDGQKYLRVKGVVKEMVWTDEDSSTVNIDEEVRGNKKRLVIVGQEISSISVATE